MWASIKLQRGFGYWNELGELVLDAAGDGRSSVEDDEMFVWHFYHDCDNSAGGGNDHDNDKHSSNDEGYDGNDYPDDDNDGLFGANNSDNDRLDAEPYGRKSSRCSEDSVDDWKSDLHN